MYYKMSQQLNFVLNPSLTRRVENLQYVDELNTSLGKRYIFGKINQKTIALTFRLNYSPAPDLSVQYYGQPFFSSGKYDRFKHINNPRGKKNSRYYVFEENEINYDHITGFYNIVENASYYSFENPDYNVMKFLSNLVLRWEYKPGSVLYLVWSQFREQEDEFITSNLKRSFNNLFSTHPDDILLIKISYWFSL